MQASPSRHAAPKHAAQQKQAPRGIRWHRARHTHAMHTQAAGGLHAHPRTGMPFFLASVHASASCGGHELCSRGSHSGSGSSSAGTLPSSTCTALRVWQRRDRAGRAGHGATSWQRRAPAGFGLLVLQWPAAWRPRVPTPAASGDSLIACAAQHHAPMHHRAPSDAPVARLLCLLHRATGSDAHVPAVMPDLHFVSASFSLGDVPGRRGQKSGRA